MQAAKCSKTDGENVDVVYETSDVMHKTFHLGKFVVPLMCVNIK
jgi:hypothetical protein